MHDDLHTALAAAGPFRSLAERALADQPLTAAEGLALLTADDALVVPALWAAFAVRQQHWGRRVKLCVLNNALSGLCPEDCGYCSQSKVSAAPIERYRLKPIPDLVEAARAAAASGARRYCMVTAARGPSARDVAHFATAARTIREQCPQLELCVSLGIMSEPQARTLSEAGVDYANHNLNTSRRHYPAICGTHTYDDRVATVENAKRGGLRACSGVIVGLGEQPADVVDVAQALGALAVESLPVNFLIPIDGTPLADATPPDPGYCLRALALFRLTNPRAEIRAAGGREHCLGDLQGLALFAVNSIFVEGYLTTPGQEHDVARRMIDDLGFEVERDPDARNDGQVLANVL
jgi:biotin synthase